MDDVLQHWHMYDYRARCAVAITTQATRELQKRHGLDPLTTIALGRAVSCVALLASTLKQADEYIHATFSSESLLKRIVAECNGAGHIRGYTAPSQILQTMGGQDRVPESVGEALGRKGLLVVTRGLRGREPYRAVSEFNNGEIATDFARYLTESEQIPSAVAAGVKLSPEGEVVAAGAVLFQKLAGAKLEDQALTRVEERMAKGQLRLSDRIAAGESTDDLVALLQGGEGGFGLLTTRPLAMQCSCTREKMAAALISLGEDEVRAIEQDTGKLEVVCHYCSTTHNFKPEELLKH